MRSCAPVEKRQSLCKVSAHSWRPLLDGVLQEEAHEAVWTIAEALRTWAAYERLQARLGAPSQG